MTSAQSTRYQRARENYFCRGGIAAGVVLGAFGYEVGGWDAVFAGALVMLLWALAGAFYATWREAHRG